MTTMKLVIAIFSLITIVTAEQIIAGKPLRPSKADVSNPLLPGKLLGGKSGDSRLPGKLPHEQSKSDDSEDSSSDSSKSSSQDYSSFWSLSSSKTKPSSTVPGTTGNKGPVGTTGSPITTGSAGTTGSTGTTGTTGTTGAPPPEYPLLKSLQLVDTNTGTVIKTLQINTGDTIFMPSTGSITIQAVPEDDTNLAMPTESVVFKMINPGATQYSFYADSDEFYLFGETASDPNAWGSTAVTTATGPRWLIATPYTENTGDVDNPAGIAGPPIFLHFTVYPRTVTKIFAWNAITDEELDEIHDGDTVCVSSLQSFTARAYVEGTVGSVKWILQGPIPTYTTDENLDPYFLFGDWKGPDYVTLTLVEGWYSIAAIPYELGFGGGAFGEAKIVSFYLTENCPLYNAHIHAPQAAKVNAIPHGSPVKGAMLQGNNKSHAVAEAPATAATRMILIVVAAVATVIFAGVVILVAKFKLNNSHPALLKQEHDLRGYASLAY